MTGKPSVRGNEIWKFLILLFHLTERCCAVEFSKSDFLYLDELLYSLFFQKQVLNQRQVLFRIIHRLYFA